MEANRILCDLCQRSAKEPDNQIKFTCQHCFCLKCLPYIIHQRMTTMGFQTNFFEGNQKELECPICQKPDKITIPLDEIASALQKHCEKISFSLNKSENIHCEACQIKQATCCCVDCHNQNYCEGCLNAIHNANKRFSDHKMITLEEKLSIMESQILLSKMVCSCPSKRDMEFYCQKCKKSMCSYCLKADNHESHSPISLKEIFDKIKVIDQKEVSYFLKQSCNKMDDFQKKTLNSFETVMVKSIEEVNQTFERIKNKLNALQESMLNGLENQLLTARNNFKLIEYSLALMKQEMDEENILNLHPNKLPILFEFFKENQYSSFNIPAEDFKIAQIKNPKLEEIEKILNDAPNQAEKSLMLLNEENWEIKIKKQSDNIFNFDDINVSNDFQKNILSKNPVIIEEGTFWPNWFKSNVSTSFILDGETFLIWPESKNDDDYFIRIYNLSSMKRELTIKGSEKNTPLWKSIFNQKGSEKNTIITLLSHYPKEKFLNSSKSYLYWADTSGVFTFSRLTKNDKFKDINKIQTENGNAIISAAVFEDIYSEINQTNNINNGVYAILSFYNANNSMLMYRIDGENPNEIVKEIDNPCKQKCFAMNFYYNENHRKCFIVGGFSGSVFILDIATGQWLPKEIKTELANISSLEILQKKTKVKKSQFEIKYYLMIGLQSKKNNLMFCDLSEMRIISMISIPNIESVYDITILNNNEENRNKKELAVIACWNANSIKLVTNFENLEILDFSKDSGDLIPINVRKVLVKDKKNGILKEHFVILQSTLKRKNQVLFF